MAFCSNCGTKMDDGAQFCPSCGTRAATGGDAVGAAPAPKPATEKVGNIRKCPACGAEVPSMTAVCPSCGHELNSVQVSNVVKTFTEQINALDVEIAKENNNMVQSGKRIGWIILNVFTYGIPVIVRSLKRAFFPANPPLLPSEQKKKSLIENFVAPNTREDIMEFILFSSSKMESEFDKSGKSINDIGRANMWAKVWSDKCKQLYAKAGVVLSGDTETLSRLNNIMAMPKKLMAQARKRELVKTGAIAGILLAVAAVVIVPASGVGVKVPDSVSIPAENVIITGAFEGQLKAAGNGFSISSNQGGTEIQIAVELESLSDLNKIVEQAIVVHKKDLGWTKDNCTVSLAHYSTKVKLGGLDISSYGDGVRMDRDDIKDLINALLKIETGTLKRISLPVSLEGSAGKKKKTAAKLMSMKTMEFSVIPHYQLTNKTLEAAGNKNYFTYVDIN